MSRLVSAMRPVLGAVALACLALGAAHAASPAAPAVAPAPGPHLATIPIVDPREPLPPPGTTYAALGDDAVGTLFRAYYAGNGLWRDCPERRCWVHNSDWGSDSLTNTLYVRWATTGDTSVAPILEALSRTERRYPSPCMVGRCILWSDVPMWDSVAASREHAVLPHDRVTLVKAIDAFWAVEGSPAYDRGACPTIRYQRPDGRGDHLKTLETDSNGIKAALLLFDETKDARYLRIARLRYQSARRYFLDPERPLYSVYVFDNGVSCHQEPHRYFASVNGNMIWDGLHLARATGDPTYRAQAFATARAVVNSLSDENGVFTDLQAENDLEEPLVEAMLELATREHCDFARRWILDNASAAASARRSDGSYGRFFDGPPPEASVTAWQTNGGFAAEIAAAALSPNGVPLADGWGEATFVPDEISHMPATIRFRGRGIALIGTLGEVCCQPGHARILIDGVETMNRVGTWQNKSSSGHRFPDAVLFAWRWRSVGNHEITLEPGAYDAKEGGAFFHSRGYRLIGDEGLGKRKSSSATAA